MTLVTGFTTPTLAEIIARISGDLNSYLSGVDAFVPGSDEWVIAQVMGGANYSLYGYQGAILRETFVQTASEANLEAIGGQWGVVRNQATSSTLTVDVTASAALTLPISTLLTDVNGLEFWTDAALVFAGLGTSGVNVTCRSTGADTTLEECAVLTFSSPILNVTPEAPVTAVVAEGSDIEGLEAYRARILSRIQFNPQGGAVIDYNTWVLEVDGVERVWTDQPTIGYARTVFDGTPSAATVQAYVDDDTRAPVGCTFIAVKGTAYGVAVTCSVTLEDPYTITEVRASIAAEIESLCHEEGGPGITVANSKIRTAIGNAAGVDSYILTDLTIGGAATGSADSNATAPATQFHELDAGSMAVT